MKDEKYPPYTVHRPGAQLPPPEPDPIHWHRIPRDNLLLLSLGAGAGIGAVIAAWILWVWLR